MRLGLLIVRNQCLAELTQCDGILGQVCGFKGSVQLKSEGRSNFVAALCRFQPTVDTQAVFFGQKCRLRPTVPYRGGQHQCPAVFVGLHSANLTAQQIVIVPGTVLPLVQRQRTIGLFGHAQADDGGIRLPLSHWQDRSPILVQGIPCIHDDLGLFDAMRRMDSVFEVRYRGHLNRGTWEEIMPQIESTAYNPMRLLMAVQKGLAERPLPYPDEPIPYMPRCADAPALQGWNFSSVLYAEPYCGNGGTILPCSGDQPVDVACLHIIQKADGRLTLEQLSFQAFDYDDLLLHEVASIQPGELRWTILVLSDLWRTWPEGALLPDRWQEYRWEKTLPEYDHETANIFGFVLDSDAKTAELSEDTPALQMFRDALKVLLRATAK